MAGKSWSSIEIDRLWDIYPDGAWPEILAAMPGRNKSMIRNKVRELGIKRVVCPRPIWKNLEVQFLRENYARLSPATLCERIPRHSWSAIQRKANSMKFPYRDRAKKKTMIGLVAMFREQRRAQKKTIEWLGKKIGVHPVLLCNYERGMAAPPRIDVLDRWAYALGFEIVLCRRHT